MLFQGTGWIPDPAGPRELVLDQASLASVIGRSGLVTNAIEKHSALPPLLIDLAPLLPPVFDPGAFGPLRAARGNSS